MRAILISISLALIIFSSTSANALSLGSMITNTSQGEANKIGIQLSQECINSIKHHVKTSCPSYEQIIKYDNTNHQYYGKFTLDKNGYFHRDKPLVPNYYNIVNPKIWVVAVDPEQHYIDRAKMIIIVPDGFTFVNLDETVGKNHTRTEYHDRYVSGCQEARISYSDFLLKDTIQYLESGCTNTNFIDHTIQKTGNTPFDMVHSQALKTQAYFKTATCIFHTIF